MRLNKSCTVVEQLKINFTVGNAGLTRWDQTLGSRLLLSVELHMKLWESMKNFASFYPKNKKFIATAIKPH